MWPFSSDDVIRGKFDVHVDVHVQVVRLNLSDIDNGVVCNLQVHGGCDKNICVTFLDMFICMY